MKTNREVLCTMMKTTQAAQLQLRYCLNTSMRPGLRKALESQLQELNTIETEARAIACQRGWELPEPEPAARLVTSAAVRLKLRRSTETKIADLLIRENTEGMLRGLKDLHQLPQPDSKLQMLSQKLLDCETANIRQLQSYL